MNEEVLASRRRVSRRRALSIGGTIGLGGFLAACAGGDNGNSTTATASTSPTATAAATGTAPDDILALLDEAPQCVMAVEETQGPYYFDVDSIRSDIREDRPGTTLQLALRVQDVTGCAPGTGTAVTNAVVEIWHCDAGGVYSGFESGSQAANPGGGPGGPGGQPPQGGQPPEGMGQPPEGMPPGGMGGPDGAGSGETSDGSYSVGEQEATTTDDGTYLRGAQATDGNGVAQFTTIFPGWYRGRTPHIHLKVHVDKTTVLTTQLFFEESVIDEAYQVAPYSEHTGRDTTNDTDSIYHDEGLLTVRKTADGYLAAVNLGIDV
ncbi:protocatechuate dioxygenase [Rhodococcus sp. HNM0569]|uniref:protocatechuate dioxygenase n=1 Tax=Rhodococcus sp. HNM0569 TaxID=2716340 RepID=UPI00146C67A9|nr:protocatechuate dioxygenase [Rhodococcus sp. HNM0569]NLU83735.1 protocatechuate dioxygenase [Rhodococcus sp. HNM0569]